MDFQESKVTLQNLLSKQFEYGARGPNTFDCYGLVIEVYKRMGIQLKEFVSPDDKGLINGIVEEGKIDFIEIHEPEPYCLVTFKTKGKFADHIGVVMPDRKSFIHCAEKKQVAIEKLDHLFWKKRIGGYYRYAPCN